jgi:predicted CXXCH cytochrome family protein
MTNAAGAELCYQCHGELRFAFSSFSHHRVDQPGTGLSCQACHNPHVVNRLGQLVSDPDRPATAVAADNGFCLKCHDGSFGLAVDVQRELGTAGAPGVFVGNGKNLHYYHVTERGAKCTSCHDPHGSSNRSLIRSVIRFELPGYPGKTGCGGGPSGMICH